MRSRSSEEKRTDTGARQSRPYDPNDDEEAMIHMPDTFEDYDELNGDNDATPDDRRRDPLRRSW